MINTRIYPSSQMSDLNLDWTIENVKKAVEAVDIVTKEWVDIKGTVQKIVEDEVKKELDSGEIGRVVNEAVKTGLSTARSYTDRSRRTFDFNGKTICIGDSYGEGYNPDGNVTGWPALVKSYLGLTDDNFFSNSFGGAGFISGTTFATLLNQTSKHFKNDEVTNIIVCGGVNDINKTETDLINAIFNFKKQSNALYPNAQIFVGFIGNSTKMDSRVGLIEPRDAYCSGCEYNGITYLSGVENALHSTSMFGSDGVHPNTWGEETIAKAISNAILNGYASVIHAGVKITNVSFKNGFTGSTIIETSQYNDNCAFYGSFSMNRTSDFTMKGEGTFYELFSFKTSFVLGGFQFDLPTTAILTSADGTYRTVPCTLRVYNGSLWIAIRSANGTGYDTFNVNGIVTEPFTIRSNTVFG
nr:MAG TPA: GDSL-esterase, psychrotrophic, monoethylphosphonate, HYDROLASE.35A [Caudoviricetes sp.]